MRNDLLSGFNGTPYVRIEAQAVPLGCGLQMAIAAPNGSSSSFSSSTDVILPCCLRSSLTTRCRTVSA